MVGFPKLHLLGVSTGFFFFFLLFSLYSPAYSLTTDGLALLALKSAVSVDPARSLATWVDSDKTACSWTGVTCQLGRVTELSLPNCSLHGYLPSELGLLSSLQTLALPYNNFSGPIPKQIKTLVSITSLDLSHNYLSGEIPAEVGALLTLAHLDLSSNLFNGSLPPEIAALPRLSGVLNLSCNGISGRIPAEFGYIPVSVSLDLQRNNLSGEIPMTGSLLNQGPTAFAGNPNLCGFPLRNPCKSLDEEDPRIPRTNPNPNPTSLPSGLPSENEQKRSKKSATVPILAGLLVVAVASILVLQWQFRRKRGAGEGKMGKEKGEAERREGQNGEIFVAVDEGFGLELEELLRASAYVVGKSRSGIVYRVVVGRGAAVAVRRLSEVEESGNAAGEGGVWRRRRDFEAEAMAIGRAKHPNVVSLRAYYYAPDEKLLVYDYISNGTLHSALHGGATIITSVTPPLSWAARLNIIQGAARGLAFLHECSPRKYIHGNIKSSKILLNEDLQPYISGFGLARLIPGAHKSANSLSRKLSAAHLVSSSMMVSKVPNSPLAGYVAPEARVSGNWLTQKCDVYSFGIVILEVLTGRLPGAVPEQEDMELESFVRTAFKEERPLSEVVDPSLLHEVYAKKQVLAAFHVALGCTELDPELRPRMRSVSESLDRIGGGGSQ